MTSRQNCAAANGITSSGAMRARICAKVHAPVPVKVRITGASSATAMLQSRLYVAIVATLAPSMPPMTTAAIATEPARDHRPLRQNEVSRTQQRKTPMRPPS